MEFWISCQARILILASDLTTPTLNLRNQRLNIFLLLKHISESNICWLRWFTNFYFNFFIRKGFLSFFKLLLNRLLNWWRLSLGSFELIGYISWYCCHLDIFISRHCTHDAISCTNFTSGWSPFQWASLSSRQYFILINNIFWIQI